MVLSIVSMVLFGLAYIVNAMAAAIVLYGQTDICDDGIYRIGCREVLTIHILCTISPKRRNAMETGLYGILNIQYWLSIADMFIFNYSKNMVINNDKAKKNYW